MHANKLYCYYHIASLCKGQDEAYCNQCFHGLCVCLLATTVSCAKTAEPIEMPSVFGDDVHV